MRQLFLQSATAYFITKGDGLLLQSATGFFITKCDSYYKVRRLLTKCDRTSCNRAGQCDLKPKSVKPPYQINVILQRKRKDGCFMLNCFQRRAKVLRSIKTVFKTL